MNERKGEGGVLAAVLTPLDGDLRPDAARMTAHCRHLLATGCDALAPLGTTGEANSLGLADRIRLIGALATSGLDMARMIIGTGTPALADSVALARAALDGGAGGLLVLPPFYYKEPSEEGLYAYFSALAEAIGRTDPRIHLYHFPQMSAVAVTLSLTRRLRDAFPGVFVGLKDSSGDFTNTRAFIEAFPGFAVYSGSEELLLDNLDAGGAGCISATTNVTAPLAQAVLKAWRAADTAGAVAAQEKVAAARRALSRFPVIAALKAVIAERSGDTGWLRLLPPNMPLTPDQRAALFAMLGELDLV